MNASRTPPGKPERTASREAALILAAAALCALAAGCDRGAPALRVLEATAVVMPNGVGAAYLVVENDGDGDDRLLSARSTAAADAQLHRFVQDGEIARMVEARDGLVVEGGGRLVLQRGGAHVMLFGVEVPEGATRLPLELRFQKSGVRRVEAAVQGTAASPREGGASSTQARPKASPDGAPAKGAAGAKRILRVCADPNNLPFSNRRGEGFENALAEIVAGALDAEVEYTWWPQRRGFLRETLKAKRCDVVMGVPSSLEMVATTRPYYRSGYVLVHGPKAPRVASLDAPELRSLRIGVPLVGDDGSNPPPVLALSRRGLVSNVRGYSVYGDYRDDSPPSALIRAVRAGEVDVAIAWGPLAGYYAGETAPALTLAPIPEREAPPGATFAFDISMGVRHGDDALRDELDAVIAARADEIDRLLARYRVPRLRSSSTSGG